MIKPVHVSELNMVSDLNYSCDHCGNHGILHLTQSINVSDETGNDIYNQYCPSCDYNLKNPVMMHLESESFNLISSGVKIIEIRLNDPKRSSLEIGDAIEFINKKTDKKIETEIVELLRYSNFEDLFDSHPITDFGRNNKDILLDDMRKIYPKEDELMYGVLGIKIKVLNK